MSQKNDTVLNKAQQEAVDTLVGPVLIVAGAGAGKTKTLSHRIHKIIKERLARPEEILAITFTNKAAGEMRERVIGLIEEDSDLNRPISNMERPFVSTFHALGVYIIRQEYEKLNISKNFHIYDRDDARKLIKEALVSMGLDVKEHEPAKIQNIISRSKGDYIEPEDFLEKSNNPNASTIVRVWQEYEKSLKKENALDFDDLLLKTVYLLERFPDVRIKYQNKWKYIHVDEYQDTNEIQYRITKLLIGPKKNICVVGDADQTIYSWRGANMKNILHFEKDYPEAKIIYLEQNYRSTQTIISAANSIIEKNVFRHKKNLFTKNEEGDPISLIESYTENEEAREVGERILELIDKGVKPKEIAVLYRANFQSRLFEEICMRKNIPYEIIGTRFFERKEIKEMLSWIRIIHGGENSADLQRALSSPPRGIGKSTILKMLVGEESSLGQAMREKVQLFRQLILRMKEAIQEMKLSAFIKYVFIESGMERYLKENGNEGLERIENVRELVSLGTNYDNIEKETALESFITNTALTSDQDEIKEDRDGVRLMTVHASKGLEFEYVFIVGLEEDLFPHSSLGEENANDEEAEEERRLFYVALTRARKKVFLSWTHIRTIFGASKVNKLSQFVKDIDDTLIESHVIEEPKGIKAIFADF